MRTLLGGLLRYAGVPTGASRRMELPSTLAPMACPACDLCSNLLARSLGLMLQRKPRSLPSPQSRPVPLPRRTRFKGCSAGVADPRPAVVVEAVAMAVAVASSRAVVLSRAARSPFTRSCSRSCAGHGSCCPTSQCS